MLIVIIASTICKQYSSTYAIKNIFTPDQIKSCHKLNSIVEILILLQK